MQHNKADASQHLSFVFYDISILFDKPADTVARAQSHVYKKQQQQQTEINCFEKYIRPQT